MRALILPEGPRSVGGNAKGAVRESVPQRAPNALLAKAWARRGGAFGFFGGQFFEEEGRIQVYYGHPEAKQPLFNFRFLIRRLEEFDGLKN